MLGGRYGWGWVEGKDLRSRCTGQFNPGSGRDQKALVVTVRNAPINNTSEGGKGWKSRANSK